MTIAKPSKRSSQSRAKLQKFALLSAVGMMFPIAITLGAATGYYLDRKLGTLPWLSAVFLGFGIVAAFVNLFRVLKKFDESS